MKNKVTKIFLIAGLCFFAGIAFAKPPVKVADRAMEPTPDSKKKLAGEECKTAAECKRHHTCSKAGEKNVCTALPLPEIPKT